MRKVFVICHWADYEYPSPCNFHARPCKCLCRNELACWHGSCPGKSARSVPKKSCQKINIFLAWDLLRQFVCQKIHT